MNKPPDPKHVPSKKKDTGRKPKDEAELEGAAKKEGAEKIHIKEEREKEKAREAREKAREARERKAQAEAKAAEEEETTATTTIIDLEDDHDPMADYQREHERKGYYWPPEAGAKIVEEHELPQDADIPPPEGPEGLLEQEAPPAQESANATYKRRAEDDLYNPPRRLLLTQDHMKQLHDMWDVDNDGKASLQEVIDFADTHREKHEKLVAAAAFLHLDTHDGVDHETAPDGFLHFDEAEYLYTPKRGTIKNLDGTYSGSYREDISHLKTRKYHQEMFKWADADKDGLLNEAEFYDFLHPHSFRAADELKNKDVNRDGRLTEKEYVPYHTPEDRLYDVDHKLFQQLASRVENMSSIEGARAGGSPNIGVEELVHSKNGMSHIEFEMERLFMHGDGDDDDHLGLDELQGILGAEGGGDLDRRGGSISDYFRNWITDRPHELRAVYNRHGPMDQMYPHKGHYAHSEL